ncbi:ABC transporter permease subunit [Paenibacillus guangzhouensis]|uniref:ABC transporter permease subunit n=1 Tax=Paenibacillus guangzhouensis TaxID=1473112 RepID=UPI0012675E85|nr:ABC transporter permease subunit [Paenibacillus guangzhouensis]
MNLWIREMKAHRKSLILWCIGIIAMVGASMSKYAGLSMSNSGASMNELMADMPKSLQAMMGVGTFDLSKASGYYGAIFIYLLLMATIHAAMLGANILSKEERDKTAEFLLVKPISRSQMLTYKLFAALVQIVLFNLVMLVSSILFVNPYSHGESVNHDIMLLMIGMFFLQLLFLGIGLAIAGASRHPKRAVSISTGILLLTFMLSIGIDISGKIDGLKYLTPFKYFDAKHVMYGGGLDGLFIGLTALILAGSLILAYVGYNRRDLHV